MTGTPPPEPVRPRLQPGAAATDDAIARHRAALRERFPLPPGLDAAPPPAARRRAPARVLAMAALAVGAALLAWYDPAWRTEYVATSAQQRLAVELADGSRVELDTGTRLAVSRHLRSRRVAIETGRALFTVQHSAWRPFLVDAGGARVRVLGTTFDVRRQGEDVTVTVLAGHVAVTGAGGASAALVADQQLQVHAGRLDAPAAVSAADATAWRQGRLVFRHTPLAEVLAEIARYSGHPVRLADPALGTLEVSGVYRTANARALLALLPTILPVRLESAPDGGTVVHGAGR